MNDYCLYCGKGDGAARDPIHLSTCTEYAKQKAAIVTINKSKPNDPKRNLLGEYCLTTKDEHNDKAKPIKLGSYCIYCEENVIDDPDHPSKCPKWNCSELKIVTAFKFRPEAQEKYVLRHLALTNSREETVGGDQLKKILLREYCFYCGKDDGALDDPAHLTKCEEYARQKTTMDNTHKNSPALAAFPLSVVGTAKSATKEQGNQAVLSSESPSKESTLVEGAASTSSNSASSATYVEEYNQPCLLCENTSKCNYVTPFDMAKKIRDQFPMKEAPEWDPYEPMMTTTANPPKEFPPEIIKMITREVLLSPSFLAANKFLGGNPTNEVKVKKWVALKLGHKLDQKQIDENWVYMRKTIKEILRWKRERVLRQFRAIVLGK